jgi:pSer/pThr/pTyr-binding forkhead associated (FHA) protein
MSKAKVKITTELKNPTEVGTYYRLICMTGPSRGKVFYFEGKRLLIGRGEKVEIQILDNKISREHAELSFINGEYVITDMSQQNGVIVSDEKVKQKKIVDGDKIVLGQTVLKYNVIIIDGNSQLIMIDGSSENTEKRKGITKNKIEAKGFDGEIDSAPLDPPKKSNSLVLIIAVLGGIFYLFMGDEKSPNKNTRASANKEKEFNSESEMENAREKILKEDPEVKRKFDMLIHSGRREYGEGNYFRAMEEFRRADLLIPGNGMASFLMSRSKQRLDEDVKKNFDKANKDIDAKKFQSASISLCGVLQMLQKNPDDDRYKNAKEKIDALEIQMGIEKGEIKCFEEKPTDSRN